MLWFDDGRIPSGNWQFLQTTYVGLRKLEESLATSVDLTEGGDEIRITGCLEAYRYAISRRTLDLVQAVIVSWNTGQLVGSVVCARALLETLATFYSLLSEAQIVANRGEWEALGNLVNSFAFSSSTRLDKGAHKSKAPPRVGKMVKRFIRDSEKGKEEFWDQICEVAHPNGEKLMMFGGVLQERRFDARSSTSNENWLFPAIYNCLYSCCWLISSKLDFDILCEHIHIGAPPSDDHPLMQQKALIDEVVKDGVLLNE